MRAEEGGQSGEGGQSCRCRDAEVWLEESNTIPHLGDMKLSGSIVDGQASSALGTCSEQ